MLWLVVAILLVLWMAGWGLQVAGIHLLWLLLAVVLIVWKLATARGTA